MNTASTGDRLLNCAMALRVAERGAHMPGGSRAEMRPTAHWFTAALARGVDDCLRSLVSPQPPGTPVEARVQLRHVGHVLPVALAARPQRVGRRAAPQPLEQLARRAVVVPKQQHHGLDAVGVPLSEHR